MKTLNQLHKFIATAIVITSLAPTTFTHAGVVVTGTRIIFESGQTEKTVRLNNKDQHPNLVQIWSDRGDEHLTAEQADGPFMANPPIFKMQANQAQVVRLNFIQDSAALPQDRESMFFLNINEIPAMKTDHLDANRLVVSFTNRLKILYRPKGLAGQPNQVAEQISYQVKNNQITLNNPTSYYAHIAEIKLLKNGQVLQQDKSLVVPPKNQLNWSVKSAPNSNTEVQAVFINDYGSRVLTTLKQN